MRVATWNVNSLRARHARVLAWLEKAAPDVLLVQETKMADAAFDPTPFAALGYDVLHHGDGQWNGVAILSRVGLDNPVVGFGRDDLEAGCRIVSATCGGIRCTSVYVPNGRALDDPHYDVKLLWLEQLRCWLATRETSIPHVVGGDFNVAPKDHDVYDPSAFVGQTHVSEPERRAVEAICELGFVDVVEAVHPDGGVFSWWDYRAGAFRQNHGLRIDLVLATADLVVEAATVDVEERRGEKPSDHAPVVVDLGD